MEPKDLQASTGAQTVAVANLSGAGTVLDVPFRPGIWLMNRLPYGLKFITIGLALLLPLGWLVSLQYQGVTQQINFNAKESIGVLYDNPLKDFLFEVQRHRVMTAGVFAGVTAYAKELPGVEKEADTKLAIVDANDSVYGGDDDKIGLKTTKRWREAKSAWQAVKNGKFTTAAEAETAHASAVGIINDVILNYAGNYSNLILDPDLDSYWLMDIYLAKAATLADAAARSSTLGLSAAADPAADTDKNIEISGLYKSIQNTLSDTENIDLKTAYDYNNSEKGSKTTEKVLRGPFEETKAALTAHADLIRKHYLSSVTVPVARAPEQVVESALGALKTLFGFWDTVSPELDKLCKTRTVAYTKDRTLGLYLAGTALGVLAYLFLSFYLSVRTSTVALAEATRRMIAGTTERFRLKSRDQLGKVVDNYNEINSVLVDARMLRKQVEKEDYARLQSEIQELLIVVSDATDGDFTVRAKVTEGSLGNVADALNSMFENIGALVKEVDAAATRVAAASSQIQASAEQLSLGAAKQADEIHNTTAAVQEMSSNIESVANNANAAAEAAKRTKETAEAGNKSVVEVTHGMQRIRENVQSGAKRIKRLGDRSMEISSIVNTIEAISGQTDMLALNAAIEAARAGEHGRGFSVVAEEVRKLAERAGNATKEISKLISGIQAETNEAVASMEGQTSEVESESHVVAEAGTSLTRIKEASLQSAELINEISLAAKQQVRGANGVVKAMEVVSLIAQQAQSGATQTRQSTGDLARLSSELTKKLSRFKIKATA